MKFSIRDLFLVTFIVAVCVAWWVDRRQLAKLNSELRNERDTLSFQVTALSEDFRNPASKVTFQPDGSVLIQRRK